MKTEYSIECEKCNMYNIKPVKCKECWEKEIANKIFKDLENLHLKINEPILMSNPLEEKPSIVAIKEYWDLKKKWCQDG